MPAKQATIYIYGDIYNEQGSVASEWGIVSLSQVMKAINAAADAEELIVRIHSRGGDVTEGFAIYDALKNSGKKITTVIDGLCASIATVPLLAGSTRRMAKNAEGPFIHNPWTFAAGDAADMEENAQLLRDIEEKLINFYVEHTGAEPDTIRAMMNEETTLTAAQALEMKFITEIIEPVKAYAMIRNSKPSNPPSEIIIMNKTELEAWKVKLNAAAKKIGINNLFTAPAPAPAPPVVKNLDLTIDSGDQKGKTLVVTTDAAEPAEGDEVLLDGAAAPDGDYQIANPDGAYTITVEGGKIKVITPAVMTAAQAQALRDEIATLRAEKAQSDEALATLTTGMEQITKKLTTSNYKPPVPTHQHQQPAKNVAKNSVDTEELKKRREERKNPPTKA